MWVYYYDVAAASAQATTSTSSIFVGLVLITGLIILAPSYFEKRNK